MSIVQPNLLTILDRFPNQREMIELQYAQSEKFRSICDDYHKCTEALRYWNQSEKQDAFQRRREYSGLLQELEKELSQNLSKHENADKKGNEKKKN